MIVSLDKIFTVLFSVLCFSLAFIGDQFYAVPNGINILLVATFPFVANKKDIINLFAKKPIVWFVIFLSFILIKSILVGQFLEDLFVIKKMFQVLLILILSSGLKVGGLEWLKSGIILGSFIAIFYSLVKITFLIINTASFNFAKGPVINETLPVQRLYLGLLCIISLILVLERFFKKRRKMYLILALTFTVFVFLIASRIAMLSAIVIIIYYSFIKLRSIQRYFALFLILAVTSTAIFSNDNLSKRVLHLDDNLRESYIDKIAMHEPRFLIWKYSYEVAKNTNTILGNGFRLTQEKLLTSYRQIPQLKKREWFISKRFNSHNQYIDIFLSQGLLGFIIFLIFLFQLFISAKKSPTKTLLLISSLLFMLIYNNFHRLIGVFIFSILIVFILDNKTLQKLKK